MKKIGISAPATFVFDEVAGEIKKYHGQFRDSDYYKTVLQYDDLDMNSVFELIRDAYLEGVSDGSNNIRNQIKVALGIPSS